MDRPGWDALRGMLDDIKRVTAELPNIQQRSQEVTGTAWSDDRTIKAVVGPRGHLLELDIDPRVYRKPNSKALAASIVATVRLAIEDAAQQAQQIYEDALPSDMRASRVGALDINKLIQSHDADLRNKGDDDHG